MLFYGTTYKCIAATDIQTDSPCINWHVNYLGLAQARPNENIITNARITLKASQRWLGIATPGHTPACAHVKFNGVREKKKYVNFG